ncbi:polyprenyl diphosphate synthase [Henriciella sp.]|uniref:polyprenyl diphosphate synthase n=1 Tax=Henriciella sp. TaxID=1968823 RepID=UPI00261EF7EC|nr:polyprenyl diphosphate synthase [Henriciella sp.]
MPAHVGIIMDGNGRWASRHGLPRSVGHERGVEALRRTVKAAQKLDLRYLTVYSFSTENWRRPVSEVTALFSLLKTFVNRDLDRLKNEGVRIRVFGTKEGLPDDVSALLDRAVRETADNTKFNLGIAFNYGGREEISRAARAVALELKAGRIGEEEIDEQLLASKLDTSGFPDPDLIIRTGEERRLSNFLVWQGAYSELVFMDVLWPEFGEDSLHSALETFASRERRFGGLKSGAA